MAAACLRCWVRPRRQHRSASKLSCASKVLSSDTLYGIVADGAGSLWLSGNAGLMRFDPDSGAIKVYHREHGLQGEEFAFGAYRRLRDGRVCFGGAGRFQYLRSNPIEREPSAAASGADQRRHSRRAPA